MRHYLDFEKSIADLEGKIQELRHLSDDGAVNIADEVSRLQTKLDRLLKSAYQKLTPWQRVQVARHPNRPHFADYVAALVDDYVPLAGDRAFANDNAIQGGVGRFRDQPIVILGHEKGNDVTTRMQHNFGMPRPEGYRKAIRLMRLAERFRLPVVTLVDTPGAYPGVGAEERGQAEAIARAIETCLRLNTPIVSLVIGEGGSGGAIAIAASDRVLMLENSVYSVISPEGCSTILLNDATHAASMADALKMTAHDLQGLGCIDGIVREPLGGAHRDPKGAIQAAGNLIESNLRPLLSLDAKSLRKARRDKFLAMGRDAA